MIWKQEGETMKNKKYQPYIYWGITGFVVLSLLIALIFFIIEMEKVKATVQMFFGILSPITYGAVLAYLLAPIYNWVRDLTVSGLKKSSLSQKNQEALGSSLATFFSVAVLIAVVVGLASMLIPQLRDSIVGIIEALPTSIYNLQLRLEQILADDPDLEMIVMEYYDMGVFQLQTWLNNDVIPNMDKIYSFISGLSSGIFTVINVLKNILIGIIVMVYLLNMKEKLLTQLKMILYGAFPLKIANKVLEV